MLGYVSSVLITAGWIALGVVFALLFVLYRREAKRTHNTAGSQPNNPANMTILLQTMRDVLADQKRLARDFNKSLDSKVEIIRKVVKAALAERDRLKRNRHELIRMMEQVKVDLARIEELAAQLQKKNTGASQNSSASARWHRPAAHRPGAAGARQSSSSTSAAPPNGHDMSEPGSEHPGRLDSVADPAEEEAGNDLIDNWVGLDFGRDQPDPYDFGTTVSPPEKPEDPAAAREAFRSLLNMPEEMDEQENTGTTRGRGQGGNGRASRSTLRTRVTRYHEAGMSVAEIARELGVGKGEVRLILSLREKGRNRRSGTGP